MRPVPPELAERLWAAVPRLFGADGSFTMTAACEELGIPRATFYWYFAGKSDLAAFFAAGVIGHAGRAATDAARREGTVTERLRAAVLAMYDFEAMPPAMTQGLLRFITEHASFLPLLEDLREVAFSPIRKLLVEGRDAGEMDVADVEVALVSLFGALEIVAVMSLRPGSHLPPDAVERSVDLMISGLLRR